MFEKFLSAGANDFRQRYEGTYGFFTTGSGKKLLVKLQHIVQEDERPYVEFIDKDSIDYRLYADTEEGFEFIPPKAGWHNTRLYATYVSRVPARQWSRGVNRRNTMIMSQAPTGWMEQRVDFPILEQIYLPENPVTFDRAQREGSSYALSNEFAICHNDKQIYLFNEAIGKFDIENGVTKIKLKNKDMFSTEITDVFRRNHLPMELQ